MITLGLLSVGQPLGFIALALPVLFLIAARERGGAQPRLVGSLSIWHRVRGESEVSSRRRKAPLTPRILVMSAAMTLGALALTAPGFTHKSPPPIWRIVLDTSPSNAIGKDESRLEISVVAAVNWAVENASDARLFWIGAPLESGQAEVEETDVGSLPSASFLARVSQAQSPRRWSRFDWANCLWLPTANYGVESRLAGRPQLEFEDEPGPVALLQNGNWLWWEPDSELSERIPPVGTPAARLRLEGEVFAVGSPLGDLARAWGEERGLGVHSGSAEPGDVLYLQSVALSADGADEANAAIERDSWSAQATWPVGLVNPHYYEPWLSYRGTTLASWRPGKIWLGISRLEEPRGDPAAFAVSWATLFENACLAGIGVVSVADRAAARLDAISPAGLAASLSPEAAERQDSETPLAPLLAVFAAALTFFAART